MRRPPRATGEANPAAVLTAADVREARAMRAAGGWTEMRLAAHFGVGKTTMHRMLKRETWREVT